MAVLPLNWVLKSDSVEEVAVGSRKSYFHITDVAWITYSWNI